MDATFSFDHNGKLYRLRIKFGFKSGYDPVVMEGDKQAAMEICNKFFDVLAGYSCVFQDEGLYQDSVEHYKQRQLEALK